MKIPSEQTQEDLEILFSKYQVLPVLRKEFSKFLEDRNTEKENISFYADLLSQIYLHRQADTVTLVGILFPKHGSAQEVANKLLIAAQDDIVDYNEKTGKFLLKYEISEDVANMLARYQYPLPMIISPKPINKNYQTGYLTINNSVILNDSEYFKDKDVCLDHINRANSVALKIDEKVINSPQGKFKKPKRKEYEEDKELKRRVSQAKTFYSTSLEVMNGLLALSDNLYMTHKYDRRGRCYASGYHVNTQGMDYHKAVLQFKKKEIIND